MALTPENIIPGDDGVEVYRCSLHNTNLLINIRPGIVKTVSVFEVKSVELLDPTQDNPTFIILVLIDHKDIGDTSFQITFNINNAVLSYLTFNRINAAFNRILPSWVYVDENPDHIYDLCPGCNKKTVRAKGLTQGGGVECINPNCKY